MRVSSSVHLTTTRAAEIFHDIVVESWQPEVDVKQSDVTDLGRTLFARMAHIPTSQHGHPVTMEI